MKDKNKIISSIWINLLNNLSQHGIDFWIDYGTLLGYVRNNKIISWDKDIDISIKYEDYKKLLNFLGNDNNNKYKIVFQKRYPYLDSLVQIHPGPSIVKDNIFPMHLDIYLYKKLDNYYLLRYLQTPYGSLKKLSKIINKIIKRIYASNNAILSESIKIFILDLLLKLLCSYSYCGYEVIPKKYFYDFKEINFFGIKVKIPLNEKEYLEFLYGNNWRKPIKNWNWKKSGSYKIMPASVLKEPSIIFFKNKIKN
jgi:lipopolysaccharide cholinephosphotransferase